MARNVYCVSIDAETLEVNEEETQKLREAKKKERLSQGIPGQEFVADLVEKREKRDFSGPTLAFFDELMAFAPGLKDQLEFEKEFSKRDLPKLDVDSTRDVVALTPYVKIVEDDKGEKFAVCSQCGHAYCKADENFKLHALIYDRNAQDIHKKHQAADPDWMVYREFYCPGCAAMVEVEGTPSCCPILHNVELKL
jgi:acetone carboxylase gamma subunit